MSGGESVKVSIARLPGTSAELFGRENELAWLDDCRKDGVHLASIVAWGGVGKSALVNKWLAGKRDKGWDGAERVYGWSFYSQGTDRLSSSDAFVADLLTELGDPDPRVGSPWDKGVRLAKLVRKERTILVLDGIEPLQWGPGEMAGRFKDDSLHALLKELAGQNEGLCLVTSRIGLADLSGLRGGKVQEKNLNNLSPVAGAKLLEWRGAKGTQKELEEASKEYDGHGLALTLLGSYLADVADGDIRKRKEIGPLEQVDKHAQRVMAAYEKWLDAPEVAILRMMGLFDRPADEGEIGALRAEPMIPGLTDGLVGVRTVEWRKAVAKLRKIGLLSTDDDKRLDAHPLVREHFGEQLRKDHHDAWQEGHWRLYEYLKRIAKPLPETIEEMAPLYAAVVHGCLAGKNQEALNEVFWKRMYHGEEHFNWKKLGAFGSEVAVLSAFFDPPWERLALGLSEPTQAFVLNQAGIALRALGRLSEAAGLMRLGLNLRIAQNDWKNAAICASNLSELLQTHGELQEALAEAQKSVELADKSDDGFVRMGFRTTLAAAQHAMGLEVEAAAQFEEAERIQKDLQPEYPALYSFQGFQHRDLLLDQGRDADVRGRSSQSLEWASKAKMDILSITVEHLSLGRAHLLGVQRGTGGDIAQATSHLNQAVHGLRYGGGLHNLPLGLLARAALHIHNRDFTDARHDLEEALTLATRCEFRLHEADAHLGYARLALAEDNPKVAQEHLAKAKAIIDKTGYHRRDGELKQLGEEVHRALQARPVALLVPNASASTQDKPATPPAPLPIPSIAMPNIPVFPKPILDAYRDRTLAVLFGSGLSLAKDVKGNFPRWNDLPDRLLDQVAAHTLWNQARIDAKRASFKAGHMPLEEMLSELDTVAVALRGGRKYQAAINAIFRPANVTPGDVHRALGDLDINVLATTNYDQVLEHAEGPPARSVYTWKDSDKALSDIEDHRKVLFKVHGSAENESTIVMTRREYDAAAADKPYQRIMSHLWQNYTFLLVGYGINDPLDLDIVFGLNASAFGVASKTHYALMHKNVSTTDRDRWQRDLNIQTVTYDDYDDLPAILRALAKNPRNPP